MGRKSYMERKEWAFRLVTHRHFENFITACIIVNTLVMCTEHYNQSEFWTMLQQVADYVFVVIFFGEFCIKVFAFGWRLYWLDHWNQFDFFVVVAGFLSIESDKHIQVDMRVLRIFRIIRLIRLVKKLRLLHSAFNTLLLASKSLLNIGTLILLFIYVFVALGMQLFGLEEYGEENANFHTF